ncbi:MAG: squalene/phytoene synthase family protein [Deltaproteobacteria bacterium]|nr:squalene/phytoene synthase family protein [Deltaproteobacteria bacterium]
MDSKTLQKHIEAESARSITEKSRSNFSGSFFFLSPEKRRAMEALYAFCRLVDDAVDESASKMEAEEKLSHWKKELDRAYQTEGSPEHPVMREVKWMAPHFSIPKKYFDEILLGVRMDLDKNRYQNFEELCHYTYGVASVVGLVCMKIFEVEGEKAEQSAILLGRALQLTNILRDIKSDATRGRIYLPLQDLERFSLKEEDILQARKGPRFDSFILDQVGRTERIYQEAFSLMKEFPRKSLLAAWIMGKVYHKILHEIKKQPRLPFERKIKLSKGTKMRIALAEWVKSLF